MGRKLKRHRINSDDESFKDLDIEYQRNDYHDRYVDALNSLPADERSMMILFVTVGNNKARLAKMLGCSRTHISGHITAIQEKLKEIIKNQKPTEYYD